MKSLNSIPFDDIVKDPYQLSIIVLYIHTICKQNLNLTCLIQNMKLNYK